jgi:hypothetical protein
MNININDRDLIYNYQKEILELKLYNKRLTEEFSRSSNDYINNNQFSGMVSRNFSKSN